MSVHGFAAANLAGVLREIARLHRALDGEVGIVFRWIGATPVRLAGVRLQHRQILSRRTLGAESALKPDLSQISFVLRRIDRRSVRSAFASSRIVVAGNDAQTGSRAHGSSAAGLARRDGRGVRRRSVWAPDAPKPVPAPYLVWLGIGMPRAKAPDAEPDAEPTGARRIAAALRFGSRSISAFPGGRLRLAGPASGWTTNRGAARCRRGAASGRCPTRDVGAVLPWLWREVPRPAPPARPSRP